VNTLKIDDANTNYLAAPKPRPSSWRSLQFRREIRRPDAVRSRPPQYLQIDVSLSRLLAIRLLEILRNGM